MFAGIFGDKPWFKSLTAWGLVIFAVVPVAVRAAEQAGLLPAGVGDTVDSIAAKLGPVLAGLGLRKAANG